MAKPSVKLKLRIISFSRVVSIEKVLIFNRLAKGFPHYLEVPDVRGGGSIGDCRHLKTTEGLTYLVEVYII